jgi:hypothetical protein
MRFIVLTALTLMTAAPAFSQTAEDEAKVRAVIAEWYERVGHAEARQPRLLMAPNGIDAGPGYAEIPYRSPETRSAAAYSGPHINNELAAQAMQFRLRHRPAGVECRHLAKVDVWERGYFYASAAQTTYERAADAMFVLEKQTTGEWKILAHEATIARHPAQQDHQPDARPAR